MKTRLILLSIICAFLSFKAKSEIVISSSGQNDLIDIFKLNGISYKNYENPLLAVKNAKRNGSVLILSHSVNEGKTQVNADIYKIARNKNLKLYIETPDYVPGVDFPDTLQKIHIERGVINTNRIVGIDSLSLIGLNTQYFIPVENKKALIVLAKVAGFDKAEYGIDDVKCYSLLFNHESNFLISTVSLSRFVTSRFGPEKTVQQVWKYILTWLGVSNTDALKKWNCDVSPSFSRDYAVTRQDFRKAINSGTEWFYNARLLVDPSWENVFKARTAKVGSKVVYPAIDKGAKIGDGELGILEGHASTIYNDGSQPIRWWLRADCQAESAFALSLSGNYLDSRKYHLTSSNLLDYLYIKSNLRGGPRNDLKSPSYGLIGWTVTDDDVYYGDDNARVILGSIGAAAGLNSDKWDKYIVEGIMANFRTTGKNGFRTNWFRDAALQKTGWKKFADRDIVNVHPHFESWLWATYLWLYDKTGYTPLLEKAKKGISLTMQKYPDWKWTNGIQQERARMILPLAWLIRVEDTAEHRKWLKTVSSKLLENLDSSGAIREELGLASQGRYGKIKSNADYGSNEAPLISENGDPVADLLYTTNFAFFALNEAYGATGDPLYGNATKRIADFLVKAQVSSKKHPELDGAWYRGFDYGRWEYWASNADSDWGPWGTLTGWTQSWILSTLIMVDNKDDFWTHTKTFANRNFKEHSKIIINTMLPE